MGAIFTHHFTRTSIVLVILIVIQITWSPPGFYIQLHIYHFNLEYEGNHCPWDYLEIYDGQTMSSSLITKACGSLGSFDLYSSGRFLFVRFHSDKIIPRSGFSAWCSVTNHSK